MQQITPGSLYRVKIRHYLSSINSDKVLIDNNSFLLHLNNKICKRCFNNKSGFFHYKPIDTIHHINTNNLFGKLDHFIVDYFLFHKTIVFMPFIYKTYENEMALYLNSYIEEIT